MKKNKKNIRKRMGVWALVVLSVLMLPLVFRAPWTLSDYIFAGVVLFGAAFLFEYATKNIVSKKYQIIVATVVIGLLVMVQAWAAAGPD